MPTVELTAGPVDYLRQGDGPPVVMLHGVMMSPTLWDRLMPRLPDSHCYIRPLLPLGAHRRPMHAGVDLSLTGQVRLLAEFLEALNLDEVTLVHSDWGGGLHLTAHRIDQRIGRMIILPCEAFDNFPPGLPGRVAGWAARIPGGLQLGARQLRNPWLRRTPLLMGQMAMQRIPDDLIHGWTAPVLTDPLIRRDFIRYATSPFPKQQLIANTEALRAFDGDALVLWSPQNRVMPPSHGQRLADLLPHGRLVEIADAYVLSMLDQPEAVAAEINGFLTASAATAG